MTKKTRQFSEMSCEFCRLYSWETLWEQRQAGSWKLEGPSRVTAWEERLKSNTLMGQALSHLMGSSAVGWRHHLHPYLPKAVTC